MNRMAVQKRIKDIEDSLQKASIVLVDIEGTTTSISYVKDKLFPYIRSNLESYVKAHWNDADFQEILLLLREQAKQDEADKIDGVVLIPDSDEEDTKDAVMKNVFWQMDLDRKTKALKQLQGHIAREGYKNGNLKGHVYPDVVPALKSWTHNGRQVYIYSSGSVEAQKLLFGHSEEGDLLDLFSGHFDTEIGPKVESSSYLNIVKKLDCKSEDVVFLTDVPREAKAAQEAGVNAVLVVREGNEPLTEEDQVNFPVIKSFHDFVFEVSAKRKKMSTDEEPSSLADLTSNGPINEKDVSSILSGDETKTEMVEKLEVSSSSNQKSFPEDVEMMDISNNDAQEINTKTDNSVSVDESETANNVKMSVEESETVQVDSKELVPMEVKAETTDKVIEIELKPIESDNEILSEVNNAELKQGLEKQVETSKTDMNVKVEVDDSRSTETENGKSDIDSTTVEVGSSREDVADKDDVEVVSTEENRLAVSDKNTDVANIESQVSDADLMKEKVDLVKTRTDSIETKTKSENEIDSVKAKTESVETKIDFVQATTSSAQATVDSVKARTDTIEAKTDSVQATTASVEGKTDCVEKTTMSVQATTGTIETKTDSVQATTDSIDPKTDSIEMKTNSEEAKTDSIETKTNSGEAKTDSIETKTNSVEAKTDSIETKPDFVQAITHSIETKTDIPETERISIETKVDSIQAKTDIVESKTDSSESKTEALELKTEAVLTKTDFSEEKSGNLEENMGTVEIPDSVEGKDEPANTSVVKQVESVEQKHNIREEKTDPEELKLGAVEAELDSSGVKADSEIGLDKVNSGSIKAKEDLVMTKADLAEVQVDETRTNVAKTSTDSAELSDAVETRTSIEEPKAGSGDQAVCLGDSKTDLEDAKDGSGDAKINIEEIETEEVLRASEKDVNIEIDKHDKMEETAGEEPSVSSMECDVAITKETEKMEMDSAEVEVEGGIRTGSVEVVESMDTEPVTKDEQMDVQITMNVDVAGKVAEQMDTESTASVDIINKVTEQMDVEVSTKVEIATKDKEQMDTEPITKREIDGKVAEDIPKETSAQPKVDSLKTPETMEVENESEDIKVEEGSTNLTSQLISKENITMQLETEVNNVKKDTEIVTDQAESECIEDVSGETTTTEIEPSSSTATLQTVKDASPKEESNVEKISKESESSNEENKAEKTVSESVENSGTGVVRGDLENEKSQKSEHDVRGNESKTTEAENGLTSTAQNGKGEDISNNGPESEQNGVLDEQDVKVKKLPVDGSGSADKTEDNAAVAASS